MSNEAEVTAGKGTDVFLLLTDTLNQLMFSSTTAYEK